MLLSTVVFCIYFSSFIFSSFEEYKSENDLLLLLGALVFLVKMLEQVIHSYYKGNERYDLSSMLSIMSKLILISAQLFAVVEFKSLDYVFSASLIASVVSLFFSTLFLLKTDVYLIDKTHFNMEILKDVFTFTKWGWCASIVGTASSQIDRWVVGSLVSMTVFGYYSIGLLIFNNIHTVFAASVGWIFPKVSFNKDPEMICKYYKLLQCCLLTFSIFVSVFLYHLSPVFNLWLGVNNYENAKFFINGFLILLPIFSLSIIPYYMVKGCGYIKHNFITEVLTFCIRLTLMLVLFRYFGVGGIIFSLGLSGYILGCYLALVLNKKVLAGFNLNIFCMFIIPWLYAGFLLASNVILQLMLFTGLLFFYLKVFHREIVFIFKRLQVSL
ncbi:oligosaccharide flippase family protein [Aeromonas rivipollensis]